MPKVSCSGKIASAGAVTYIKMSTGIVSDRSGFKSCHTISNIMFFKNYMSITTCLYPRRVIMSIFHGNYIKY